MRSLKFLALLALLLSLSLAIFADTSKEVTHAKDEVKPSEATDDKETQPHAVEAKTETNDDIAVEPQQIGFCRFGCCGWSFGRCLYCCRRSQAEAEAVETEAIEPDQQVDGRGDPHQTEAEEDDVEAVEPQKRWVGGCRYGCCGYGRYRRCIYCCKSPQAEAEVVEPQQRRGCRYGCCGSYAFGRCSYCCPRKVASDDQEENKKEEEAKP